MFEGVLARLRALREEHAASGQRLGEVPDDFLDPIVASLMSDPVILPSSKQRCDRSVRVCWPCVLVSVGVWRGG